MDKKKSIEYMMYHFVGANIESFFKPSLPGYQYAITLDRFRRELDIITSLDFTTVSLSEIYRWQTDPGFDLPFRPVVITFDGANREWVEEVAPELTKRDMKAVFYTITGWVEKHAYTYVKAVGWNGLRELKSVKGIDGEGLFEVESHSVDHVLFKDELRMEREVREQLRTSKAMLDDRLGQRTRFFALPDGKYGGDDPMSEMVRRLAGEEGYLGIRTSNIDYVNIRTTNPFRQSCRYVAHRYRGMGYLKFILEKTYQGRLINTTRSFIERLKYRINRLFN